MDASFARTKYCFDYLSIIDKFVILLLVIYELLQFLDKHCHD